MKRVLTVLMLFILITCFTACEGTPMEVWRKKGITQLVPIAWGYVLYSSQDTYGLLDGYGEIIWENEIEDAKRARWRVIDDNYYVTGDSHLIIKINIEDGGIIWGWTSPTGSSSWIVGAYADNLVLAYDQRTDYDRNPISLRAMSATDLRDRWKAVDTDYHGILFMPRPTEEYEVLIIPTKVDNSAWIDAVSTDDGGHLWRIPWGLPPSGFPVVIGQTSKYFWAWRDTGTIYEISAIDRTTGKVIGSTASPTKNIETFIQIGERIYVRFEEEVGYFDSTVSYTRIDSDWMPLCALPHLPDSLVVTSGDCRSVGIMNTDEWSVETFEQFELCYSGVAGTMPGEFYLIPEFLPYDYSTRRYLVPNEKLGELWGLRMKSHASY